MRTITSLILLFFLSPALELAAQVAAAIRCGEVAEKIDDSFWDELRSAADDTHCRKAWVERTASEFLACASVDNTLRFGSALKVKWNAFFDANDAEWGTLGPRMVGAQGETGTIQGGFKRTYLGAGLPTINSTVTVTKTGGRARGVITVCAVDQDGNVTDVQRAEFASGRGTPAPLTFTVPNPSLQTVGVVVDTPAGTRSLSYTVSLTDDYGEVGARVEGIADLHIHQFAERGFGGRMLWGDHRGPKRQALAPEVTSPGSDNLIEYLGSTRGVGTPAQGRLAMLSEEVPSMSLDANVIATLSQMGGAAVGPALVGENNRLTSWSSRNEDGFFQVGGGGAPTFADWPHHADRSHQMAHLSWLRRAHQDGLNLIVVSLVNSPFLCTLMSAFDAYGNVREFDENGNPTGDYVSSGWDCNTKANIDRQLDAAHALDRDIGWYEIAMSPGHARDIINRGNLAVVLSIESDGILNDEFGAGDFEDELLRLRGLGVSTLQIVHERDSRFCGAAPHRDDMEFIQSLRFGPTGFDRDPDTGRNRVGLTGDGEELIDLMIAQGMPIDLAHASVTCRNDVFDRIERHHAGAAGLYDSHTKFEKLLNPTDPDNQIQADAGFIPEGHEREEEFLITEDIIDRYREHEVLVGLRTAAVDVYSAPPRPNGRPGVRNSCPGSARSFAQLVDYATQQQLNIAFGSDVNGLVAQVGPRYGPSRCYAANTPYGQTMPDRVLPEPSGLVVADDESASRSQLGERRGTEQQRNRARARERQRQTNDRELTTDRDNGAVSLAYPRTVQEIDGQNYYRDGMVTIAWLPELYQDLLTLRTPGARRLGDSAESYVQMWERATGQR